jgi:hypothetical protein
LKKPDASEVRCRNDPFDATLNLAGESGFMLPSSLRQFEGEEKEAHDP